MQDNINKVITNALNVDKTNMNENVIKDLIKYIKVALENNKELILKANKIDKKNNNGFELDDNIIKNIFTLIEKEDSIYGKVVLSQKDNEKQIIYGKQIMDRGIVALINDGNSYIILELVLRNLLAGNTIIISNSGYMFGTNNLIVQIIQSVLESLNISKYLVQIFIDENYSAILSNYANIDLVVCVGNHQLQRKIIENSKIPTIISGYENFDLYIEDKTNLSFIKKIIKTGLSIQLYIKKELNIDMDDAILVDDIDEAIAQINCTGNRYACSIFTKDAQSASKFIKEVKSSIVVVNTSPTIERIIDIKQESLYKEKTIIYPNSFKFTDTIKFSDM